MHVPAPREEVGGRKSGRETREATGQRRAGRVGGGRGESVQGRQAGAHSGPVRVTYYRIKVCTCV
jgi:hypothetical protein